MTTKKAPKKTVSKKVTKKSPAKKSVKKSVKKMVKKAPRKKATKNTLTNKKSLVITADQSSFWVNDGQILNSLLALRDALHEMEKTVFQYHVRSDQNDFSDWVKVVLRDEACATELKKARTPNSARTVVVRHLKNYKF